MLRPMLRRRVDPAPDNKLRDAIAELEVRALALSLLPSIAERQRKARNKREENNREDPASTIAMMEFSKTLYLARKISLQQYVFYAALTIEGVHDGRVEDGLYPDLEKISNKMREIEIKHGLKQDEYWPRAAGPKEWQVLSARWDRVYDKLLAKTFAGLEGGLVSNLFACRRREFDRLRERGRRSVFHKNELVPCLADTVKRYEVEARAAAGAKAYTAAVALLGAALEGLLLLRCLRAPKKSAQLARVLPAKKRPKTGSSPSTWTFDTLIEVCFVAGWLPSIETPNMSADPAGLAHSLRQMRNNIHPGRVCTENPWVETELRDYEDAELIYTTLFATVFRGHQLARLRD